MKKAYIFPGQGSQFAGMGKALFDLQNDLATKRLNEANHLLGFDIAQIMTEGTLEDLTRTLVTQPAIFLHSVIVAEAMAIIPDMVAGHSLGEFSALVVSGALSFGNGLKLVAERAAAMQAACDLTPSTMAAIVGLEDSIVEEVCHTVCDTYQTVVVPANYNAPGQLVISGTEVGVDQAVALAKTKGAKIAKRLPVNGAFHSPLMLPAQQRLAQAIAATPFEKPRCPIYQNVDAKPYIDPLEIKSNLNKQLTSAVCWTQSVLAMHQAGACNFIECGPGKVLQGLVKRIVPEATSLCLP